MSLENLYLGNLVSLKGDPGHNQGCPPETLLPINMSSRVGELEQMLYNISYVYQINFGTIPVNKYQISLINTAPSVLQIP